jgi:FMN phosphatase YigB (HAD superfamily)
MSLTVLFDLDDTLLDNDINRFLPGYLNALARHMEPWIPPAQLIQQLLASTGRMTSNTNPAVTLEEAFNADFYPALGKTKAELIGPITDFYEQGFPKLQNLTRPREAAVRLVTILASRGYQVVVATNPLFPRRAITHRLTWAGLPVESVPFALVTSFETFHFSKPQPAYYAEILAQLGWPAQPAVMVGNSLSDDLIPAGQLGIPGFWVRGDQQGSLDGLPAFSRAGGLDEILPWLEEMEYRYSLGTVAESPAALLAMLRATPAAMDTFSRALAPDQWHRPIAPQEWCYTEILCHLRDSDREINQPRVKKIRSEETPFIQPVDADAWSKDRAYCGEDGPAALRGFMESRAELLEQLDRLTLADWERPGRHAIFGPTTLRELLAFSATHDRSHVAQALATLRAALA